MNTLKACVIGAMAAASLVVLRASPAHADDDDNGEMQAEQLLTFCPRVNIGGNDSDASDGQKDLDTWKGKIADLRKAHPKVDKVEWKGPNNPGVDRPIGKFPELVIKCEQKVETDIEAAKKKSAESEAHRLKVISDMSAKEAADAQEDKKLADKITKLTTGDRHRIFKQEGMPSSVAGNAGSAEGIAKAASWTYVTGNNDDDRCEIVYKFKGNTLAGKTKSRHCPR